DVLVPAGLNEGDTASARLDVDGCLHARLLSANEITGHGEDHTGMTTRTRPKTAVRNAAFRSLSSGLYRRLRNHTGSADFDAMARREASRNRIERSRAGHCRHHRRWGIAPRPENAPPIRASSQIGG